ncbi:MAG: UDP-N-acetylglucosamine--N-acetylmuramyl-(pentapeptide) pyrophosphoryl-undecaprenol N-acetylglucosamine transferase [Chloroflexota bacterium]
MRLLICAGGTGGGVYPALTVLHKLGDKANPVLWVGGEDGMDAELVKRQHIPFRAIPAAGIHGVGARALPGNLFRLAKGTLASRRILREFQPNVLFFTGGYVAVPMALMAIPINSLLYVPDIEPGLALKTLARYSDCIAVTVEESRAYFPHARRVVVTGYPLRSDLKEWTRAAGRRFFGIDETEKVLLVFGGSKGARSINRAVVESVLPVLLPQAHVIHITGQLDWAETENLATHLPRDLAGRYHRYPYLHEEMGAALAAADLAVCRSGASTLGELPYFGLPAILVPYPFAWRYQKVNAEYLAARGAAVILENDQLPARLSDTVVKLINDPALLAKMRTAMLKLSRPEAAEAIADLLLDMAAAPAQQGRLTTW